MPGLLGTLPQHRSHLAHLGCPCGAVGWLLCSASSLPPFLLRGAVGWLLCGASSLPPFLLALLRAVLWLL